MENDVDARLVEPSEDMVDNRLEEYCRDRGIDYGAQPERIRNRLRKMAYNYCYHELNQAWTDDPAVFYDRGADKDTWRKVYHRLRSMPGRGNLSRDDFAVEYFTDVAHRKSHGSFSGRDREREFIRPFVVTADNPYTGGFGMAHMEFPYLDDFIAEDEASKKG